jgi:carbon-monoxide dehydrogenase small subunit
MRSPADDDEKERPGPGSVTTRGGADSTFISLIVNGSERSVVIAAGRRLLSVLRDDLALTGAKAGCEVGVCGACTVLVDGHPTSSCTLLAVQADGREVTTVEGLAELPVLRRLQQAFVDEGGFQCGFCTSGQLVAAAALLLRDDAEELTQEQIRDHMLGNLCRCTGYYGILRAIDVALG